MEVSGGRFVTHVVRVALVVDQVLRHEDNEDSPHAVIAEPFGRFVADDVGDARGHLFRRDRSVQVLAFRHHVHSLFHALLLAPTAVQLGPYDDLYRTLMP